MIEGLRPYPEYRNTSLPWLPRVPKHWEIKRAKSWLHCVDERSKTGKEELLTVSSVRGVVPRKSATVTMFKAKSYAGYKLCWPGDLVINSLWAWAGGLGVSREHGIISSAYGVYRVRPDAPLRPAFVHEVVRSSAFNWELQVRSKGIWVSRLQLTDVSFLDTPIHVPPPNEQDAIVRFLGHASHRIESYIRAKRKLIALLNEQKQAIIHRAVTRGLTPNGPMKDSGVPWLGEIPAHWEVRRLGRLAKVFNGTTPSRAQPAYWANGTVPWLASGKVNDRLITTPSEMISARALEECSLTLVPSGALVLGLVGQGKTRGMCALLAITACINQNLAAVVPGSVLFGQFLYYTLVACYDDVREFGRGGNQPALNCEIVGRFPMPVPPVHEQKAICQAIDAQVGELLPLERTIQTDIALMREYRARLIADVVTGQLDVREAALRLPVEELESVGAEDEDAMLEEEPEEGAAA